MFLNLEVLDIDELIAKRKLSIKDFESLKKELTENPESGDLIQGAGGIRKIRIKSIDGGKSGGFRICYYDDSLNIQLLFILIYSKNKQEDLSNVEKQYLKKLMTILKSRDA